MTNPLAAYNALTCALAVRLTAGDECDDDIADGFRDEMDWPWKVMTDAERRAAGWDSIAIDDAMFGNTVE